MCGTDLWSVPTDECLVVCKEDMIESTVELCDMFKYEYIFGPPCCAMDIIVQDTFDQFTSAEVLVREDNDDGQYRDSKEKAWSQRVAASLYNLDEDDEECWSVSETLYRVSTL